MTDPIRDEIEFGEVLERVNVGLDELEAAAERRAVRHCGFRLDGVEMGQPLTDAEAAYVAAHQAGDVRAPVRWYTGTTMACGCSPADDDYCALHARTPAP